jgi:uncharacterized membrane protein
MEWFVFALLAPMAFAIANIFDKYILTKKIKDPFSYNIITMMLSIIPLVFLLFLLNLTFDFSSVLAILYGVAFAFLYVVYNKALMKEEASRIISLMYTFPIFVVILSSLFLNEYLNVQKYLGIILLVASAFLVSYKKMGKKFTVSITVALILFYAFGSASLKVLTKYALYSIDYWSFFYWSLVGDLIGALLLLLSFRIRKNFIRHMLEIDKKTFLIVLIADVAVWIGYLFLFIATSLGQVSLVTALMSIQPLIVFIFTIILTVRKPKILKEEINKTSLLLKSMAVILILVGSYLIIV